MDIVGTEACHWQNLFAAQVYGCAINGRQRPERLIVREPQCDRRVEFSLVVG
jgi:hypothetical protein